MHRIRSVGVMSVAKISALVHAAMGLLFIPFFLLMALSLSMAGKQVEAAGPNPFAFIGPAMAFILAIFAPVFYGVMGFVMGAIGALLYNLMARWAGGIELELEVAGPLQPVSTAVSV